MKLVLDKKVLAKYNQHYFLIHPRAKKVPIERPFHPSINEWMILSRMEMNTLKQKWKDFICWWVKYLGYENLKLNNFEIIVTTFFDSKGKTDPDNLVPKFILDGFTESGMIVDDNGKHLKALTLKTDYDKNNPRTEIEIIDKNND